MALPTGLASQLGVKAESTYGEFKTPAAFYEFDSETLSRNQNYLTSTGLRAGRMGRPVGRHKPTTRGVAGDIVMKVPTIGFGTWLNLLHGETVTPEKIGTSTAYKQIHKLGSSWPAAKSLTAQIGVPGVDGNVIPFSFLGTMLTQLALSCDTGAELMATLSCNAKDVVTSEALATPSYPAGITSFDFTGGEIKVASDTLGIIPSASVNLPLPLKVDRFGIGSGATAAKPLPNDYFTPTGTFNMEFLGTTQYSHFVNCDTVKVILNFEGAVIAEGNKQKLKIEMPACHFTGDMPQVGGPDVVMVDEPFEAYDNGTEPITTIEYVSIDTAI
jgi:hypothetical protein